MFRIRANKQYSINCAHLKGWDSMLSYLYEDVGFVAIYKVSTYYVCLYSDRYADVNTTSCLTHGPAFWSVRGLRRLLLHRSV